MKYKKILMVVSVAFMGALSAIERNNEQLTERIGAINYHRMVLRSQEHENIMDKEIEDGIARRHPEMQEDFRSRRISASDVRLVLEIAIELIAFIKKIVDLHEKEDDKKIEKKHNKFSADGIHQQQAPIFSLKDTESK